MEKCPKSETTNAVLLLCAVTQNNYFTIDVVITLQLEKHHVTVF